MKVAFAMVRQLDAWMSRRRVTSTRRARRFRLERLEQRELLAADWIAWNADLPVIGEGESSPAASIMAVDVSSRDGGRVALRFSGPTNVADLLDSGVILDAISVRAAGGQAVTVALDELAYDAQTRVLTWQPHEVLASGLYVLEVDGAQLSDGAGSMLRGGYGGVAFPLPSYGAEDIIEASGTPIQTGDYSVPSLVDWNGDGTLDLVTGEKTPEGLGKIRVYMNEGTNEAWAFSGYEYARHEQDDVAVSASGCLGVFPRVADWDGDGRKDLLLGLADGRVQYALNEGSDESPVFGPLQTVMVGMPGEKVELDVGKRATLELVDWDDDGRLDLLVGSLDGRVHWLRNAADSGVPDFHEAVVLPGADGELTVPTARSSIAVADINGDGRKDLLSGNTAGELWFYANIGTDDQPVLADPQPVVAGGQAIDLPGIPRSRPFVTDFSGDGIPDLLVGAQDGLVRAYVAEQPGDPVWRRMVLSGPGETFRYTFEVVDLAWHNRDLACDVTGDGVVSIADALLVIDELNVPQWRGALGRLRPTGASVPAFFDVDGDGYCTPLDALEVIDQLVSDQGGAEGEAYGTVGRAAGAIAATGEAGIDETLGIGEATAVDVALGRDLEAAVDLGAIDEALRDWGTLPGLADQDDLFPFLPDGLESPQVDLTGWEYVTRLGAFSRPDGG